MKLSANKAHKLARVSKTTLLESLEKGTLSGEKNAKGHWLIDQSELLRVFPENRFGQTSSQPETPKENTQKTYESNILQVKLDAKEERISDLENQIADLRTERDDWKDQAKTLLITNQNAPAQAENSPRGGLFGFFKGKG